MTTQQQAQDAHAARQRVADELAAAALPLLDLFLADALTFALSALDGPVLLATAAPAEPFSAAGVRQRFANRLGGFGWLGGRGLAEKVAATLGAIVERVALPSSTRRLTREQARIELEKAAAPEAWEVEVRAAADSQATLVFNQRQLDTMAAQGALLAKRWVATLDDHTRPTHRAAHGQVVPITAPFRVGAELLQFPGDPTGTPAVTYNCRCVVVPGG
jgi:hypothetical protein